MRGKNRVTPKRQRGDPVPDAFLAEASGYEGKNRFCRSPGAQVCDAAHLIACHHVSSRLASHRFPSRKPFHSSEGS
ncbi:MAG: hypothetical protein MUF25_23805, partial [Pirellulaceae bacterium]|nr:hypothetical protein [Pirellulaceae bacterium]